MDPTEEIERYLRTGRHDDFYSAWHGRGFFDRAEAGTAALRQALVGEVLKRAKSAAEPAALVGLDVVAFTRAKVAPMVLEAHPRAMCSSAGGAP